MFNFFLLLCFFFEESVDTVQFSKNTTTCLIYIPFSNEDRNPEAKKNIKNTGMLGRNLVKTALPNNLQGGHCTDVRLKYFSALLT